MSTGTFTGSSVGVSAKRGRPAVGLASTPTSVGDAYRLKNIFGDNIQLNGDAAWAMIANLTLAEAKTFMDDRASKGVNAMMVSIIEHKFTNNTPTQSNVAGDEPFNSFVSGSFYDFTDPNASYWNHVDDVINYAFKKGITLFLFPCYLGYTHNDEGWGSDSNANSAANHTTYGEWLGNRYKNFPNIVWVIGGDEDGSSTYNLDTRMNNLANGIKTNDTRHMITAHGRGNISSSGRQQYNETWLDFNTIYEKNTTIVTKSESEYTSGMPQVFIEGSYGNEAGNSDLVILRQMLIPILNGCIGHFTGSSETWSFSATAADAFRNTAGDWNTTLDDYGAQYLTYIQRLQAARDLPALAPDFTDTFVTAGKGSNDWTHSPVRANSSMLVGFCNAGATLTVDYSQFSGSVNVRWYSPIDGSSQTDASSPHAASGSEAMNPPSSADWILLIDLVSDGLGVP